MTAPNLRTLVLKKDYTPFSLFPLSTILAQHAFTRVLNKTCELVSAYDIEIKTQHPENKYYWPSVVRSLDPVNKVYRDTPSLTDEYLFYRDHAQCMYCNKKLTLQEITFEHVTPVSKGGLTTWDNIVAACTDCNSKKGNQDPKGQWAPRIKPWIPTMWDLIKLRKEYPITLEHESWRDWIGPWNGDVQITKRAA
jgi:5-methylcytosine-specific restriction endonuclease McrA